MVRNGPPHQPGSEAELTVTLHPQRTKLFLLAVDSGLGQLVAGDGAGAGSPRGWAPGLLICWGGLGELGAQPADL